MAVEIDGSPLALTATYRVLGWIESAWPDLVVLDPHFPDEGTTAFQRVRSATDVPVVLISLRGDAHERAGGLKLGADDFVPSPLSPEELAARVGSVPRRTHREPTPDPADRSRAFPLAFHAVGRRVCVHGPGWR